ANGFTLPFYSVGSKGLLAAVASLLLGIWWAWGHRRQKFPAWAWPIDFLLIIAATTAVALPMRGLGLFYAGVQLRALYVSRRQLAALIVTYDLARLVTAMIVPFDAGVGSFETAVALQLIALTVVAATMHAFVSAMHSQALAEEAL